MSDGKNELEQLVQENLKHEEIHLLDKKVIIKRVCCIKINPNWKFPNQLISAILIISAFSIVSIITVVIPTIQIVESKFQDTTYQSRMFRQMTTITTQLTMSIQSRMSEYAVFQRAAGMMINYSPQTSFKTNYLVNSTSRLQVIKKLNKTNIPLFRNRYTEYYSYNASSSFLLWAEGYSLIFSLGMINSQTIQDIRLPSDDIVRTPMFYYEDDESVDELLSQIWNKPVTIKSNVTYQCMYHEEIAFSHLSHNDFSISMVTQVFNKHDWQATIRTIVRDCVFTMDGLNIQSVRQLIITNLEGMIINVRDFSKESAKIALYNTSVTGITKKDWIIVQNLFKKNIYPDLSKCGITLSNQSAVCFHNLTNNTYDLYFVKMNSVRVPNYPDLNLYLLINIDPVIMKNHSVISGTIASRVKDIQQNGIVVLFSISLGQLLIIYMVIRCIMRPFRQIIQFTDQYVDESRNKKKIKQNSMQLSSISGSGLAGQLIDAYKRLFQGTKGLRGNKNEICERIQNLQYPRKILNQDQLIDWKPLIEGMSNLEFKEEIMEQFSQRHKFNEREYKLQIKKLKQSGKDSYSFFLKHHKSVLRNHVDVKLQSNRLQEAILKMIVFDSEDQQRKQLLLQ